MRMIGTIPTDTDAERFSDYLVTQQIGNMVEESAGGDWAVWIEHDDHVDRGKSELHAFLQNPSDPKYGTAAARQAQAIRQQQEKAREKRQEKFIDFRTRWGQPKQWAAPLTLVLIVASCIASLSTQLGRKMDPVGRRLQIASVSEEDRRRFVQRQLEEQLDGARTPGEAMARIDRTSLDPGLSQIRRGQVWRLVTPIFLHFGILHLLFNMFWLRDLGGQIEVQRGTWRLAAIVLACAVIPNLVQYYWAGPFFGGMSGVVYGLFGYVWVKARFQPWLGLGISDQAALIMIAWLVIAMTGMLGPIANAAHLAGLIVGAGIAFAPVGWKKVARKATAR